MAHNIAAETRGLTWSTALFCLTVIGVLASTQVARVEKALAERQNQQADVAPPTPATQEAFPDTSHLPEFANAGEKLDAKRLAELREAGVTRIVHDKSWFQFATAEGGTTYVLAKGRRYAFHMYTLREYKSGLTDIDLSGAQPVVRVSNIPEDARSASRAVKVVNSLLWDVHQALEERDKDHTYRETGKF